ncbi:MAG: sigma-70 family RNA polymerase sigma factor [Myxococcaceae bacterium]
MNDEIAAALESLPGLSVDVNKFRQFAAPHLGKDVNLPDLLLAWASLQRDRAALAELDRRLERTAASALSKYGDLSSEILQEVREKLLVGNNARLRAYTGRGALVRYLRAVMTTTAIDKLRERDSALSSRRTDDDALSAMASGEPGAETGLFNARAKAAFATAFKAALNKLTPQERMLLRMKFVDELSVEEVGRAFNVHRTTALRWLEKIHREVLAETRAALQAKFQVEERELDGFMGEMELSVGERLSTLLPAMKK